jgi:predicted DsbA family dithiol-disulfide isomerase
LTENKFAQMMTIQLTIYSDYICPWCYVGQGVVEKLKTEYPLEIDWRPFYLRPDTPPEGMDLPAYIRERAAASTGRLQAIARSYGMDFVHVQRFFNTRRAHEATEYAREQGKSEEFHRAVFHQVYGLGHDISAWEVLGAAALEAGLDAGAMQSAVESGKYSALVQQQITRAHTLGVTAVPTYVLNNRYGIVGTQPYEVFQQAIARLMTENAND